MHLDKTTIETSIPDVFAQQVYRHGQRPAIVTERYRVTYQELDVLTNRIANALIANGHCHGQTVAILLEQGIPQIASILGILKTGGIYVPLDLALGRQRLRVVLQDANPHIILTDRINRSLATLISSGRRRMLIIEEDLQQHPDEFQVQSLSPNDSAYVYYTSGTTGDPKGVVDNHRNILHNIARYTNTLNIGCSDRLTLLQSCGFSGAVSNIFTSLLNGAVLLPFDVRARGVSALAKWLTAEQPTIFHSVPSLFRQLMRYCDTLPNLRIIRLEGDLVRPIDIETFNRHFDGSCTLVNGLGATETGITAQYFIKHGASMPGNSVPVGKATQDICIDVVDEQNRPVRQGDCGEIVITSRYLARGYWRRPELTEKAFSEIDSETRSYRTGDLGRIDRLGLLELHGRLDSLTKIRGEWVDLNALEAALTRCAGVKDAIVAAPTAAASKPELTAWVLPDAGTRVTPLALREALRSQGWPQNSTPARFLVLDHWPLDLNGKVDRKALATTTEPPEKGTELQTRLEQLVAKVFEEILEVPSVSRTDDFFELGGDSLKAVEACLEIGRLTGSSMALGLFQHASSVAELAHNLSEAVSQGNLVPLQPLGDDPALFCVHAHMGHVFNLRQLAIQFAPEQKFFGLQAKGLDGIEQAETTLPAMAATYIASMREVQPQGPYLIAGYCFGSWVAVEIARQLCDAGQQVNALFLIDPQLPAGILPKGQRGEVRWQKTARFLERLRGSTPRSLMRDLRFRLYATVDRVRVRLLWLVVLYLPTTHWLSRHVLRRPPNAIAVMALDYRPAPYEGDACILIPNNRKIDLCERHAWESCIEGSLEFESLAGNAKDLLHEPYSRDVVACVLARINALSDSEPGR